MSKIEKIKNLVATAKKQESFSWLSRIPFQNAEFNLCKEDGFVPIKNVTDSITVRKRINESRGKPIKGFNLLIKNLHSTKYENVSVQKMIVDQDFEYHIFTDPNIDELFGILKIPTKPF